MACDSTEYIATTLFHHAPRKLKHLSPETTHHHLARRTPPSARYAEGNPKHHVQGQHRQQHRFRAKRHFPPLSDVKNPSVDVCVRASSQFTCERSLWDKLFHIDPSLCSQGSSIRGRPLLGICGTQQQQKCHAKQRCSRGHRTIPYRMDEECESYLQFFRLICRDEG